MAMAMAEAESIHKLTDEELKTLATKAIKAKERAYCPYSNFRVGACVLVSPPQLSDSDTDTPSGNNKNATLYFAGANVEVASTPVGICAERCAMAPLVASYTRPHLPLIRAIAVSTDISPAASPCGMCRQFIREFSSPSTPIYMYDFRDDWRQYTLQTIDDLLPLSFGPGDLDRNKKGHHEAAVEKKEEEEKKVV